MITPLILFLAFSLWTLFHWQDLPSLLRDESETDQWPISIHHTATPLRIAVVTSAFTVFCVLLYGVTYYLVSDYTNVVAAGYLTVTLLISAHFLPFVSGLCSFVRYFFQRHLFFPALPSHQEDHIIRSLMTKAEAYGHVGAEIENLHNKLKDRFRGGVHALNVASLKNEYAEVCQEVRQLRHRRLTTDEALQSANQPQLKFHLYSCYRLLTRLTLSTHWSGRERRRAFRSLGYSVNASDGDIYARLRRLKHVLVHIFTHNRRHHRQSR